MNLILIRKIQGLLQQFQKGDNEAREMLLNLLRPGVAYLLSRSIASSNVGAFTEDALRYILDSAQFGSAEQLIRTALETVHTICGANADKTAREVRVAQDLLLEIASLPELTREVLYRYYAARESPEEICINMNLSNEDFRRLRAEGKAALDRIRQEKGLN